MFALAAAMRRSAAEISGRLSSHSLGTATGILGKFVEATVFGVSANVVAT